MPRPCRFWLWEDGGEHSGHRPRLRALGAAGGHGGLLDVVHGHGQTLWGPRPRPPLPWLRLRVPPTQLKGSRSTWTVWGPTGAREAHLVPAYVFQRSWGLEESGSCRNVLCLDLGSGRMTCANTVGYSGARLLCLGLGAALDQSPGGCGMST